MNRTFKKWDVVQLVPEKRMGQYGGMCLVVTEVYEWGVQGYLMSEYEFLAVRADGRAFKRVVYEDCEYVGKLPWVPEEKEEE